MEELDGLTFDVEDEGGALVRRELDRLVVGRGAWTTVLFLYQERDPHEEGEAWRVLYHVLPALTAFVDQVCAHCPRSCLARPTAGMAEAFFGPQHPASTRPRSR